MSVYFEAANIIQEINAKKSSVKRLVYGSEFKNKKALYALVCETLKHREILETILEKVKLVEKEKTLKKNKDLAAVLLYEHLLGRGVSGHFKECFSRHKSSIHSQCELLKIRNKVTNLRQLITENQGQSLPKYVRVNRLKTTTEIVIQKFKDEGRELLPCTKDSFETTVKELTSWTFLVDPHIPDLLVFVASTDFHENPLYLSGEIILQDKASCFPAYILSPPAGSHIIDCCAAPGNKTSHLAAIIGNKGKVFAFDKDKKRLNTLRSLTCKAGAVCIEAMCQDFLSVDPSDDKYRNVEYILVDPSCSGSGMINRTSQNTDETNSCSKERLEQLSKFQTTILQHALSFPSVRRVVYSTCSFHEEENEQVVQNVLSKCGVEFRLLQIQPDWPARGVKGYEHAHCCLRMSHDSSLTNGFFVACFERNGTEKKVNYEGKSKNESIRSKEKDKLENISSTTNGDVTETCKSETRKKKAKRKQDSDTKEVFYHSNDKKLKLSDNRFTNDPDKEGSKDDNTLVEKQSISDHLSKNSPSSQQHITKGAKRNKKKKKKTKKQITR